MTILSIPSGRRRPRPCSPLARLFQPLMLLTMVLAMTPLQAAPAHGPWTKLLQRCVMDTQDGHSTVVDYDCFAHAREELAAYLASLGEVSGTEFEQWSRDARLAFLINAYNAWTVQLILTEWPDLNSIRDLGSLLRSPWKKSFIPLFGDTVSLDDIEHGMIRAPGRYDDPRIHFAVNCASIGCPALRREAYSAERLDAQLEEQTTSFLADRSRNRMENGRLALSPLFDWYQEDFERTWRGSGDRREFLARYADALGLDATQTRRLLQGELRLDYLPYDWSLNAAGR